MTAPLPPEVLAKIEEIGTFKYRYGYRGKSTTSWGARGWGARIMAEFSRDYWCAMVCPSCGAPFFGVKECSVNGYTPPCSNPITRAAFVVAQKEREGR